MNGYPKRRASLIGLAAVAAALLIVLFVGTVSAQGATPQGYWGNCYYPQNGITVTVPYGYGCGWDDGWMGGMMGWPGYGFNPQTNVTGTVPYGYGMMGNWDHGWMMGGWGHGMMMGGWRNRWGGYIPSAPTQPPAPSNSPVSFKSDVQPIFTARCVACHGGIAGLYLNSYDNVMRGGVHGAAVVPGDSNNSRLIQYVSSGYMPFRNPPLTAAQIQTLVDWVAAGAPNN